MTKNKIFNFSSGGTLFAWVKLVGVIVVIIYGTYQVVKGYEWNINATNQNHKIAQQNKKRMDSLQSQLVTDVQDMSIKLNAINIKLERNSVQLEHLLRLNKLR